MHVLGIDAGGTKTVCLLADEHGHVLAEGRGGGANLHTSGELEVEKVLHHVMEAAIGDRDITPAAVCLGIAGVDREDEARTVRTIMRRMSVAALGPLVQRASELGDAVATRILERAADELVLAARSVATRLEMRGDAFDFVLAGGVFPVVPWLGYEVAKRLMEVAPRSQVRLLEQEPAVGAVCLALAEARGTLTIPKYK